MSEQKHGVWSEFACPEACSLRTQPHTLNTQEGVCRMGLVAAEAQPAGMQMGALPHVLRGNKETADFQGTKCK